MSDSAPPTTELYSPRQIFLASYIGGPIGASFLMAQNMTALANKPKAQQFLLGGFVGTILVIGLVAILPLKKPGPLVPLIYSAAIFQYAKHLFDKPLEQHLAAGGLKGSWWAVIAASLIGLVIVSAMIVAAMLMFPNFMRT